MLTMMATTIGGCCTTGTTTEVHMPSCTQTVTVEGWGTTTGGKVLWLRHGGDFPMTKTTIEMSGIGDGERLELVNDTPNGVMVLAGGAVAVVGAAMVGGGLWLFPDGPSVPLVGLGAAGLVGGAALVLTDWHPAERVVRLPDHCGSSS
jgi:hypothetical protein